MRQPRCVVSRCVGSSPVMGSNTRSESGWMARIFYEYFENLQRVHLFNIRGLRENRRGIVKFAKEIAKVIFLLFNILDFVEAVFKQEIKFWIKYSHFNNLFSILSKIQNAIKRRRYLFKKNAR